MSDLLEPLPPAVPAPPAGVSVLLLARNDAADIEESVAGWVEMLRGLGRPIEVIVVDDASSDGTAAKADGLMARFPEVRVVHHARWQGIGASLRKGLAEARQPLLFYTLANRHYRPADFGQFLEAIKDVDVAAGCRVGGPIPWWLRSASFCHRWFCQLLFGLPIEPRIGWLGFRGLGRRFMARWLFAVHFRDPECVYALYRREIFDRFPIQSDGAFAPVEVLAKANFLVESGVELPITYQGVQKMSSEADRRSFFSEAIEVFRHPKFGPSPESLPADDGRPFRLSDIAHGRSGDKGNHANIAVIAYTPAGFDWLKEHLTAERVQSYFAPMHPSQVERFEAANVLGLNFLLRDILHGGASQSLNIDTQGKTLALTLLQMPIDRPANWREMVRGRQV